MQIHSLDKWPNKLIEYVNLIESEFGYSKNFSYEIDFAPLFKQNNLINCLYIEEENNIVATAAFINKVMTYKSSEIKICMIGAMSTKKKFQGKGYFKKLFSKILEMNRDEVGLFFLWSDQHSLYEKFGFFPTGKTVELGSSDFKSPKTFNKIEFQNLSNNDLLEIEKLYKKNIEQKYFSIKRTNIWDDVFKVTSADLYIKRNNQNNISAYFFCNKGFDLTNIIHEFSSDNFEEDITLLKKFKLWLPENFKNYNSSLNLNITALVKIGNLKIVEDFINGYSDSKTTLVGKNEEINFTIDGAESLLKEKDFLSNWLEFSSEPLFQKIQISPYISGIDSI